MPSTGIHAKTVKYLFLAGLLAALFLPVSTALAAPPPIINQATATFQDANANNFTALSNTTTVTVTSVYTVSVTSPPDAAGGSNTLVYYPYTVTNTGNDNNTFNLTAATGSGLPNNWAATIYFDADASGTFTAGDTITASTGLLAPAGIYRLLVGVAIPLNTPNGTQDDTTLDVTGTGAGVAATAQDNVVTTAQAPNLTVVKAVRNVTVPSAFAATAGGKPGDILEYRLTVTNGGAIAATAVVLTDPDNAYTTYVPGSIWIGSNGTTSGGAGNVLQDDNNTGAETCAVVVCGIGSATAGGAITANLGNGATELVGGNFTPTSTVYVYFQVRVD